jgi:adenylate cyclase
VNDLTVINDCSFDEIRQSYLFNEDEKSLRIRIKNDIAFLTIKGQQQGISRDEFEYEIPKSEAEDLIRVFQLKELSKKRYYKIQGELTWEIDVFQEKLNGLVVAEIELPAETTVFEVPNWIGEEVTYDKSYLNAELIKQL